LAELERRKRTFSASGETLAKLQEIVRYCREHGIKLFFVIPPQHEDVRSRIQELGMGDRYVAFKAAVNELGATYDCDVSNALTRNRANFLDPFHTTAAAAAMVASSIWSGQRNEWCDMRLRN
jgi:hypothetical protein